MISHRLANLKTADCIYVMKSGAVAEYGSHDQLLSKAGVYAELWDKQEKLENYGKENHA